MTLDQTTADHDDAQKPPTLSRLRDNAKTVSSSDEDVRGRMVKDKHGQDLGKIEGLMIDDVERKVRFMEVGTGGFLGFGERKSFIPVETITRITADEVHIDRTREHVAGAPPYDPAVVTEDARYFFGLYPYYGYAGYEGFFPTTTGYPYTVDGKTPTGD
ncbi:MAG: PRC-barrel domain-containing protein [Chloroflexota bacterium]|nr:PRC-barrel domain-containing protein [Chloroflexota bacterium]